MAITGKDRVEAAFNGEKLDRQPVFLLLGGNYAKEAGYTFDEYLTKPEAALETVKYTCTKLDSDILLVPFNPFMTDAQEALRKKMGKAPSIKRDDIKEVLPRWEVRDPRDERMFSAHLDVCGRALEIFPEYHLQSLIGGPWSFSMELRGPNEALEDIYDDKQFLHDLMKFTTDTVIARCLAVVDLGIAPFLGDPSSGMSMISPAVYREFVFPSHKRIIDAVHESGGRVIFHICGFVEPIYEDLLSLGVDALSIDAPSSLEKLFEVGRGKTTIIGNVDPILFVEGTWDQLREQIQKCLDIADGDPKYIIGPGCQIPVQANPENIKHFVDYAHKNPAY